MVLKGLAFRSNFFGLLTIYDANNVTVDSCFFENSTKTWGSENYIVGVADCNLVKFNNCSFKNCSMQMLKFDNTVDLYITNCIFQNMTEMSPASFSSCNLIKIYSRTGNVVNILVLQ